MSARAWLFQFNPLLGEEQGVNRITRLRSDEILAWPVSRWAREVQPGDLVFFWESGPAGGLRGWGVAAYFAQPSERRNIARRRWEVPVRVIAWHDAVPVAARDLFDGDSLFLRNRRGGTFRVQPGEAKNLAMALATRGVSVTMPALIPHPTPARAYYPELGSDFAPDSGEFDPLPDRSMEAQAEWGPGTEEEAEAIAPADSGILAFTPEVQERIAPREAGPWEVDLWFATNRRPSGDPHAPFLNERRHGGAVTHGRCVVHVPTTHKFGSLGSNLLVRAVRGDDRLRLVRTELLQEASFGPRLAEALGSATDGQPYALMFVHGYCVKFADAALRAAQLTHDLKARAGTFFSWGSRAATLAYTLDEAAAGAATTPLGAFIRQVDQVCAEAGLRLHVIAHSMGNRVLVGALKELRAQAFAPLALDRLVFAAPDHDGEEFVNAMNLLAGVGAKTLYASRKDLAIWFSTQLHGPRAGYLPPVTIATGVDTIDASHVDATFLGHSDYATERPLLGDIYSWLSSGDPPAKRASLRQKLADEGPYWQLT